eukprot:CAMPEP_0175902480 /NCGR_PEP_ID=MMETSP0108-20121206/3414_1 /TAXON_ID=195067 ORGANISM="Goniomonas pacifica, Strain CCMP1869" /NCGR_SAMPLE_ID=MMETSP0108 /ASSEMBLY_ACC=CAM_ASM_000204 /LENGTH=111 /DNA_ID=CAMNT_0017224125 /DNA_START=52 /DNA_END=387 /DNA_ORIENTATION=-
MSLACITVMMSHFNGILFFLQLCCLLRNVGVMWSAHVLLTTHAATSALWERVCSEALSPGDSVPHMQQDVATYVNAFWETDSLLLGHTAFHAQRRRAQGMTQCASPSMEIL